MSKTLTARQVDDLVFIPGGVFRMGSNDHYPEEAPVRAATVEGFWIERTPVTNRSFAAFVQATGYVTLAERPPRAEDYPDADPALLKPGSAVFTPPPHAVDLRYPTWWQYVVGASWRRPEGPGSSIRGREDHPVVHVAYEDALAYAAWKGRSLPTEAQWERAARGGVEGLAYAWGDELEPGGRRMANTWRGEFPFLNLEGRVGTSPVGTFPENGYGLVDMIGNVWEWTIDLYDAPATPAKPCCTPQSPTGGPLRRVLKGGSHLCAPNYCRRYRPAARHPQEADTSTSHIGFRCIANAPPP